MKDTLLESVQRRLLVPMNDFRSWRKEKLTGLDKGLRSLEDKAKQQAEAEKERLRDGCRLRDPQQGGRGDGGAEGDAGPVGGAAGRAAGEGAGRAGSLGGGRGDDGHAGWRGAEGHDGAGDLRQGERLPHAAGGRRGGGR